MPDITVTATYSALIVLLMSVLSTLVGLNRGKFGVALGDGGQSEMALSIRRFGNLSEYAAAALLILLLMELRGISAVWLHAYGAAFLLLRLIHPFILFDKMGAPSWQKHGRLISAAGTAALMAVGALALLVTG